MSLAWTQKVKCEMKESSLYEQFTIYFFNMFVAREGRERVGGGTSLPDNRMALSSTLFFSDRKKINIRNSKTKALILKYFACTLLQPNRKLTYQNIIIIKLIND